jgi:hypothetical protein
MSWFSVSAIVAGSVIRLNYAIHSRGSNDMNKPTISLLAVLLNPLVCSVALAGDTQPKAQVSLMGMLLEWRYPESEFNGAQMSDAAVKGIQSIKSKAILTTPDSAEKVLEFYRNKLNVDAEGKNLDEKEGERVTTDRSVLIQDVSVAGNSKLYVIAINEIKSSTTLVVSRTDGAAETRIAWSNFRQLGP